MPHRGTMKTLAVLAAIATAGCTQIVEQPEPSLLLPPVTVRDSVDLEIFFVRFAPDDPEMNEAFWPNVDEQRLDVAVRRRWESNGFRGGVLGTNLPTELEHLLNERPLTDDMTPDQFTPEAESKVRRRWVQARPAGLVRSIAFGEQTRIDEIPVLMAGEDGAVTGRTYRKVLGQFAIRPYPQGDGRARLSVTPELEYGEPRAQYAPAEDGAPLFTLEIGPDREPLQNRAVEGDRALGEILVLGCRPHLPGSLGHQFFMEERAGLEEQKLMLVRLAQSSYDDRFGDPPPATTGP